MLRACILSLITATILFAQDNKKPYQYYEEAERYYNRGLYQTATEILDKCLLSYPNYSEAYRLRSNAREQLNDPEGAFTDLSIFLERFPDNADALLARGILGFRLKYYDQAKTDLKHALHAETSETNVVMFRENMSVDDKNPVMTTAGSQHKATVYNYLGLIESKLGNYDQAISLFDSAIARDNREPDFFVNRGLARDARKDPDAFTDFEIALRLNPNHTLALHNLNATLAKQGKQMSTEERLTKTISNDSTVLLPYLERAQQRYAEKNYAGALDDYNHALLMKKDDPEIWFGRGQAKEKLEDFKGAFSDYTKAIEMEDNDAKFWLSRGNLLLKMNRPKDAVEDYTVALIYYPDFPYAFFNRGVAYFQLKMLQEACADLSTAEKLGMKVDEKLKTKACSPN